MLWTWQEKQALVALAGNAGGGLAYFSTLAVLWLEHGAAPPPAALALVAAVYAALLAAAAALYFAWAAPRTAREPLDERDRAVLLRARSHALRVLQLGVVLVIAALIGGGRWAGAADWTVSGPWAAHALLGVLCLAAVTDAASRLYFYHRGV